MAHTKNKASPIDMQIAAMSMIESSSAAPEKTNTKNTNSILFYRVQNFTLYIIQLRVLRTPDSAPTLQPCYGIVVRSHTWKI